MYSWSAYTEFEGVATMRISDGSGATIETLRDIPLLRSSWPKVDKAVVG